MYGKCVSANYQNVSKDMCAKEFMALKDCYLVWPGRPMPFPDWTDEWFREPLARSDVAFATSGRPRWSIRSQGDGNDTQDGRTRS